MASRCVGIVFVVVVGIIFANVGSGDDVMMTDSYGSVGDGDDDGDGVGFVVAFAVMGRV